MPGRRNKIAAHSHGGESHAEGVINRPFSQIAAISGLSGMAPQIVIGLPITTRAVNMGNPVLRGAQNAGTLEQNSGAFSQKEKDKLRWKAYLTGCAHGSYIRIIGNAVTNRHGIPITA